MQKETLLTLLSSEHNWTKNTYNDFPSKLKHITYVTITINGTVGLLINSQYIQ